MKIGKKGYKGKPYHGGGFYEFLDVDIDRLSYFELRDCLKELGYEPGQCVLYVKLPRSTAMLGIKSDYDATLIAECLSHGDILDCFVCHFVADPILVPLSLEYGKSGVGEEASQNSGPNASFDVELEPIHEAQENAIHEAQENASNPAPVPANSNTSSHVHSFTAPNTPPPTHQTPTHIHHSIDPTLDLVHPSSDPIPDHVSILLMNKIQIENH
uniref:PB1-like domain-containing protein n=1 Tax=Solanum tuberosum TaxID=4113 RepID=M1DXH4_SOLTU